MAWTWLWARSRTDVTAFTLLLVFCIALLTAGTRPVRAAEAAVTEFPLAEGEIRFDGQVLSVDVEQNLFTLAVTSFTNPNGRSGKVEPPKPRQIAVNDAGILHVRSDVKQRLKLANLSNPDAKTYVVVIGRDGGTGQPIAARRVAVWNIIANGRYSMKATPASSNELPAPSEPPTPATPAPAGPATPTTPATIPVTPPAPLVPAELPKAIRGTMHSGPIWAVAYSPDGKLIATAGSEMRPPEPDDLVKPEQNPFILKPPQARQGSEVVASEVKLWDATTGALRASWPLQANDPQFNAMRYTIALVDPRRQQELQEATRGLKHDQLLMASQALSYIQTFGIKGTEGSLWPLAFSPDGSLLAAGGLDGTARLWNTHTGAPVAVLSGHGGRISGIAFTPDGKQVITSKGSPFAPLDMLSHTRASVARTPLQGEIRFWDTRNGELQRTLQTGDYTTVTTVAVSPDGTLLAANVGTHPFLLAAAPQPLPIQKPETLGIRIYDLATGRVLRTIQDERVVHRVVFSPDGTTLAGATLSSLAAVGAEAKGKEDVRLWDVATGKLKMALSGIGNAASVAISPDGKTVAACTGDFNKWNGQWMLWDGATGQPKGSVPLNYPVLSVAFAPDGATLATGGGPLPGTVTQWNTTNGEALAWKALATEP